MYEKTKSEVMSGANAIGHTLEQAEHELALQLGKLAHGAPSALHSVTDALTGGTTGVMTVMILVGGAFVAYEAYRFTRF